MIDEAFRQLLKKQIKQRLEQKDRCKLAMFQIRQELIEQYGEGLAWNQSKVDRLISMTLVTSQSGPELQNLQSSLDQRINAILSGDSQDVYGMNANDSGS